MLCVIDANIYLSFLLKPFESKSPPTRVVEMIVDGAFDILFPEETAAEIRDKVATKPYLREYIDEIAAEKLIGTLRGLAVSLSDRQSAGVEVRDPADVYLLDMAYSGAADFLITGDRDLQAVRPTVSWTRIITPAEFVLLFQTAQIRE
jgi:putative PIN family toxin of toxin-antitoxin system